jgi:hypothetical protein
MAARWALAATSMLIAMACSAPAPRAASSAPGVDVALPNPAAPIAPCGQMGCVEGMLVHFVTPPRLGVGEEIFDHPRTYEVEVEADGRRGSCRITVPCSIAVDEVCTGELRMRLLKHNTGWYDRKGLEDQRFAVTGFTLPSPPRQLRVRVLRDGELVGEHSATPVVRELRPNGAGCEPVCRIGEPLELKLPIALVPDQPRAEQWEREREERKQEERAREQKKAKP